MNNIIKVTLGDTVAPLLMLVLVLGCGNNKIKEVSLESGLIYEVLEKGTGAKAINGDEVIIHETTSYRNGSILFTTKDMGVNLPKFVLGSKTAIEGVEEGILGMRVGELRKLIVPPALSKRAVYPKFISPDSILVYKIKLVALNKPL